MLHQLRREGQATQERAETLIGLSTEQGFSLWLAWGTLYQGWALAEQGQEEEGIAQVRWSMTAWQGTGAEAGRTYYLALLAEAYGKAGQADKGLAALADAPAMVEKTGDRRWEAELYRLKGELTLKKGAGDWRLGAGSSSPQAPSLKPQVPSWVMEEAEECFHKAIAVARRQQAKLLELRATVSLARLWQRQGKKEDAHHMLADIYGWFTEGFDTKDLQEAKVLLDSLASRV